MSGIEPFVDPKYIMEDIGFFPKVKTIHFYKELRLQSGSLKCVAGTAPYQNLSWRMKKTNYLSGGCALQGPGWYDILFSDKY